MKKKLIPTKDRPATSISMRIHLDLLDKLKRVAAMKGMAGYQSLMKFYIGQGLLRDVDLVRQIEKDTKIEACLKNIGLSQDQIQAFWKEMTPRTVDNPPAPSDDAQRQSQSGTEAELSEIFQIGAVADPRNINLMRQAGMTDEEIRSILDGRINRPETGSRHDEKPTTEEAITG